MLSIASKALFTVADYLSPSKTMPIEENMDSFEARLATFQGPQTTGRKRASTTKGGKSSKWNLKDPSAEQLAQAGFYFAPTGAGSDNVTCFCCEKSLDGWEEGDNPFSEHLHFSSDCAWAILMAIENDADEALKTEDPMSDKMIEARRQTFRDQWPHEKKRGWTCKIQKMIEGGWYFSPSPEGEDQTNCVYCKKSLWGWEPKDKPYDEHKKRSPDCTFFLASQSKLATKGRKGRVSKASRMSNQSIATVNIDDSVAPIQGTDDTQASLATIDMSMASTTSKAKKGTKGKKTTAKNTRAKDTVVPEDVVEDMAESVIAQPARATRGKKRTSEQMLEDSVQVIGPPKKRTTRNKASTATIASRETSPVLPDVTMDDVESSAVVSKKGGKGGKKRASSITRKPSKRIASTHSIASQASLHGTIPKDDEIDAALEADLQRFDSDDDDSDNWKVLGKDDSVVSQIYIPPSKRISNMKATMLKGQANASVIEDRSADIIIDSSVIENIDAVPVVPVKKTKAKAGKKAKQGGSSLLVPETQTSNNMDIKEFEESLEAEDRELAHNTDSKQDSRQDLAEVAQLTTISNADDSGHETDGSVLAQSKARQGGKQSTRTSKAKQPAKKAGSKAKKTTKKSAEIAFEVPQDIHSDDVADELEALQAQITAEFAYPTKQASRTAAHIDVALDLVEAPTPQGPSRIQDQVMSPEASPQASDAENQPPSSRPSQTRPPLARFSPTGARTVRVPLAPSTPTASPSKRNARLETTYPWAPADIDYILTGTPAANRENVDLKNILNTEEKRMTLEEWVNWNAKKNEDKLKAECERMVGKFENEGVRALKTLEGIVCSDL